MQQSYQQLLTDVIKKQIIILGPDITLAKARNVKGLVVADDGTVTDVGGNPQEVTQALVDQFVQLSGEIVKKTMEPLLLGTMDGKTAPIVMPSQPVMPQPIMTPAPSATPPVQELPQQQTPIVNTQKSVQ